MRTQSYPSDITYAQWALIEPHLPVYPGGRPRRPDQDPAVDFMKLLLPELNRALLSDLSEER
jgi:putative transposase